MNLTDHDREDLIAIAQSRAGQKLLAYLEKVENYLNDMRTLAEKTDKAVQVRLEATALIKELLIDKLRVLNDGQGGSSAGEFR